VGRIAALLEDIKAIESRIAIDGFSINADLELAGKRAEINLIFEDAPTLTDLENLTLQCAPDIFFQTLVNCIKNNALSHQASIFKIRNLKKQNIKRRMVLLKQNFNQNIAEILELERVLTNLVESELRDELLHYKTFEHLNNEKITPHFMNLVKSKKTGDSLENLKKNDGTEFTNVNELKEYVRNYYRDIYKQENNAANNCTIENVQQFLGPVAYDPIVVNAKLTNEEREALESDITEIELTQSINNANLSSAPGADGISNRFIKNFWEFFKRPLLKLCQTCHLEGRLPTFLKTANIKLIPKKGDTSKIKNWRPISLLNCFYKIISRVVTTRLRKFMDKMTPICQKGYSGSRYCQEVLISVMDNIERLNTIKKRGCLISLDIKKAFDSLSHSYLNSVYKFYNFGPKLIRWLTILCTNRQACIIIDNNITTEFFDLERGNAQGDTISPFLFNLGYQILLFKLELSLQIVGLLHEFAEEAEVAERTLNPDPVRNPQVRVSDPKAFALADAKIKNTGVCFADNALTIIQKIHTQANFWKRFNLSLPGRINVAKTFLYSQINYLGCFLPLSHAEITSISKEIENFVCGKLRIARNRVFQKKCEGGLDLIDLHDYIGSQTISWLKRAYKRDDLWKAELFAASYGSIFNLRKHNFNKKSQPILHNIASQAEKFVFSFTVHKENFMKSAVFENPCLTFDLNGHHYLKKSFFTLDEWALYHNKIKNLTLDQILNNEKTVKSLQEFSEITGMYISDIKFNKLRGIANCAVLKFSKNESYEKKTDTVQNFLMRIKKGSKTIRNILQGSHTCTVSQNIIKYAELTDTFINADHSRVLNSSWVSMGYLHNSVKTFIFKLHNNILGINSRVAHFVRNHPSTCTFCDITQAPEENSESIKHLFF